MEKEKTIKKNRKSRQASKAKKVKNAKNAKQGEKQQKTDNQPVLLLKDRLCQFLLSKRTLKA